MDKKTLSAIAKEMNEVMGLKPAIKVTLKPDALTKAILKEANHPKDGVVAEDEFTEETWAGLAELGCPVAQEVCGEEPEEPEAEEEEPEPEEEEPEAEEVDLSSMSVKELKAHIAENEYDIPVPKSAKAPAIIKLIEAYLAEPEEEEPETPTETAAEKKKREKAEKAEKEAAKKKPAADKKDTPAKKSNKGPGVIASIITILQKAPKKGVSYDDIHAKLVKIFPDRDEKSLMNTIRVQVPSRINKERDFTVEKNAKGFFTVAD